MKKNKISFGLVRIGIGVLLFFSFLLNFQQKDIIWGDFSNTLYYLFLISTLLFILGLGIKINQLFILITFRYFEFKNPWLLTSGDFLIEIILFYFLFCDLDHFSIDHKIKKKKRDNEFFTFIHNLGLYASETQIVIVYFFSFFYKYINDFWFHGTALYYIEQYNWYTVSGFFDFVKEYPLIGKIITFISLYIQLIIPILILIKKTRIYGYLFVVGFHLIIGYSLGLFFFSFTMIFTELLFFTDEEWMKFKKFIKKER